MKKNKDAQFLSIVEENEERIKRICRYYNSNTEDQEDMYQEVLMNIWKSMDKFRGEAKLSTWVYRVAVNTALNIRGKTFKRMKVMIPHDTSLLNPVFDEQSLTDKLREEKQLEAIQTEMNLLSIIDKAILSLFLEQIPLKEIADIIGITEPNVRVKLHRIKNKLKESLTSQAYEMV